MVELLIHQVQWESNWVVSILQVDNKLQESTKACLHERRLPVVHACFVRRWRPAAASISCYLQGRVSLLFLQLSAICNLPSATDKVIMTWGRGVNNSWPSPTVLSHISLILNLSRKTGHSILPLLLELHLDYWQLPFLETGFSFYCPITSDICMAWHETYLEYP